MHSAAPSSPEPVCSLKDSTLFLVAYLLIVASQFTAAVENRCAGSVYIHGPLCQRNVTAKKWSARVVFSLHISPTLNEAVDYIYTENTNDNYGSIS